MTPSNRHLCGDRYPVNYLNEWSGPNGTGNNMVVGPFNQWFNYTEANRGTTTSFNTGRGSVVFAGHRDGGSSWYPMSPGPCYFESDLTGSGSGWNDRIQSRLRIDPE